LNTVENEVGNITDNDLYASVNAGKLDSTCIGHILIYRVDLSRRSDLESLGYVLLRFLRGNLPWEILPRGDITEKKQDFLQELDDWPQLAEYLEHLRALEFHKEPDYSSLHMLFTRQFKDAGFVDDNVYDSRFYLSAAARTRDRLLCNQSLIVAVGVQKGGEEHCMLRFNASTTMQ